MRVNLLQGNALQIPLDDCSIHSVITSPPYYGLRDYGISGQLGLEETLQEYINNTVMWAREVWRVLRDDGTFWLNMGDSYAGNNSRASFGGRAGFGKPREGIYERGMKDGLKTKDLMGVPWRVALALQEDGWWLRSDIIWAKPNPMPESVTDRPTKSHEYIFLLTKKKNYYYDADAVREPQQTSLERTWRPGILVDGERIAYPDKKSGETQSAMRTTKLPQDRYNPLGRNKRSVWNIATKPYPGAHFATFPPEIPETCIKAGTSENGVCPMCGNGWVREVKASGGTIGESWHNHKDDLGRGHRGGDQGNKAAAGYKSYKRETKGWMPSCDHKLDPIPAKVLDPFAGSGTTIMVANALGRIGIGLDLSADYLELAKERTGIKAIKEWQEGKQAESNLENLPMFEGL